MLPNLEYIMEECVQAGIKQFIFVVPKNRPAIKKYFFNDSFYKNLIKKKKKDKRIKSEYLKIKKYQKMIKFVYQNKPKGTGDAVLKCKNLIKSKFFLLLMPDDLIIKNNCSRSLINLHKKYNASMIASMKVKSNEVSRWGILKIKKINNKNFIIKDVIEKPDIKKAPSNYAVIGRYVLPKSIFKILKNQKPGKNGEIHITDSIRTLINNKNKFIGHIFAGKYLDCGSMNGYIKSTIEISKL